MRKLLYTFATFAVLGMALASCQRETPLGTDSVADSNPVQMTFDVSLDGFASTKAYSDGNTVDKLAFLVYDQNSEPITGLTKLDVEGFVPSGTTSISVSLVKGVEYNFVFFAQKEGHYTIDAAAKTLTVATPAGMMNDDRYDAFYATELNFTVPSASFTLPIKLKRPFAQINVGATDYTAATANGFDLSTLETAYTLDVPTTMNLLTGAVGDPVPVFGELTAAPSASSEALTVSGYTNLGYLSMAYVLCDPAGSTADLKLRFKAKQNGNPLTDEVTRVFSAIPLKRNFRTNILGAILTTTGNFDVTIDHVYDEVGTSGSGIQVVDAANVSAANTLFAASPMITYGVNILASPSSSTEADYTIKLPKTNQNIYIGLPFNAEGQPIKIVYADDATDSEKPAKVYVYAYNSGSITAECSASTVTLVTGSTVHGTLTGITSPTTLIIEEGAKVIGTVEAKKGSLVVEGEIVGNVNVSEPESGESTPSVTVTSTGSITEILTVPEGTSVNVETGARVNTLAAAADADASSINISGDPDAITNKEGISVSEVIKTVSTQEDFASALSATNTEMTLSLKAGTYTFPTSQIKFDALTVQGGEDVVLKLGKGSSTGSVVFKDIQIIPVASNYSGISCPKEEYHNVQFYSTDGKEMQPYATEAVFDGCSFTQTMFDKYALKCYGSSSISIKNCNFTGNGKAMYIFRDLDGMSVSIENCTFKNEYQQGAQGDKSAIMVNAADHANIGYTVSITNCSAEGFYESPVTKTCLWGIKNPSNTGKGLNATVTVDGKVWKWEDGLLYPEGLSLENGVWCISSPEALTFASAHLFAKGGTFQLQNDIDMTGIEYESPVINSLASAFVFDGNGKTISNLSTEEGAMYAGLFGKLNPNKDVTIKDLTIKNATLNPSNANDDYAAGALIGWTENHSNITYSIQNVTVDGVTVKSTKYAGGLIGWAGSVPATSLVIDGCVVKNSTINSAFTKDGTNYQGHAGGVVGYLQDGTIKNTTVAGSKIEYTLPASSFRAGALAGTAQENAVIGTGNTVSNFYINETKVTSTSQVIGAVDARNDKTTNVTIE